MDQRASYGLVARTRTKDFNVRVGLGGYVGVSAMLLHPSWIPLAWFALLVLGQLIDRAIARRMIAKADNLSAGLERIFLASCALNAAAWGAINIYLWLSCGVAGQLFGLLVPCGGLIHAVQRLYPSRAMLIACSAPHALYLVGLPVLWTVGQSERHLVALAVLISGALLYVAHMITGAREAKAALVSLLRQRELAEQASAAKSEFLATVSHEIRTPMNAVLSAAHLLKRTTLSPEQAEHVAMLTSAGDVLMSLLNDVLDISKIEAGKMQIDSADADVGEVLKSIVDLWEPQAADKGMALRFELDPAAPPVIRTDPLRLRQILFNLTSNAVKFTESGQILLKTAPDGLGMLVFEVVDTGCGIDAEAQSRLFGSFEQASAGLSRRHGGTGLGLAISRKLAELMGGSLTLSSTLGEGSTFRLELPLVLGDAVAQADEIVSKIDHSGRPLEILVAEDHPVNRRIVSMFLEPMGWRLTMAENGQEAVDAAALSRFDVILMDMQMPLLDGIAATQAIRAGAGPNAATPVIALTANALGHHRDLWLGVGVDAFLTKPIEPDRLVETILVASRRGGAARQEAAAA